MYGENLWAGQSGSERRRQGARGAAVTKIARSFAVNRLTMKGSGHEFA
jgi:hypothetical protein